MDIKLNPHLETISKVVTSQVRPREAATRTDDVDLVKSRALEARLAESPEVRAEVVERGKELAANPKYPPGETIQKIANLLAINYETAE